MSETLLWMELLDTTISLLLYLTYKECTEADEATTFILYTQCLNRLFSSPFFKFIKNLHNLLRDFLNIDQIFSSDIFFYCAFSSLPNNHHILA